MELEITPEAFYIGDVNVGQSVVVAWGVMVVLIALAIAVKIKSKNFTEVPKGLQNLLELGVETIQKYSKTAACGRRSRPTARRSACTSSGAAWWS